MVSFDNEQVAKRRTSKGKQKIDIKRIEKKSSRHVTFSKRRNGLFKKCNELCSLKGSEYAVITFSLAGKPISSGFPSPDAVIQRFLSGSCNNSGSERPSSSVNNWWDNSMDNKGLTELEEYKAALEGLRKDVLSRVDLITLENELLGKIDYINVSDFCRELFDADDGIDISVICQEKVDFGEAKLEPDDKESDYMEWLNNTAPEIYPDLLPIDASSYSLVSAICSC